LTDKKKRRSLQKFVHDEKKKKIDCFLCRIPEKEEIAEARNAGAQLEDIYNWLITECGYDRKVVKAARKHMSAHLGNHLNKEGKDDWEATL